MLLDILLCIFLHLFLAYPKASSYALEYSHSRVIAPVLKGGAGAEGDGRHGSPVIQREVGVHDEILERTDTVTKWETAELKIRRLRMGAFD